jgi:regulator of protease activity HflC (stomatin/prohibitin superfamily)
MSKWVLTILALLLLGGGLYMRNQNHAEAAKLAVVVLEADKEAQDTKGPLETLRAYTALHMGASASLTLQDSYERARAAAEAAAAAAQAANSQIYADAQRLCGGRSNSLVQAKCNQDYLAKHLSAAPPATVTAPKLSDYQYRIRAPWWTPDLAGALMLGGAAALAFGLWGFMRPRLSRLLFWRRRR